MNTTIQPIIILTHTHTSLHSHYTLTLHLPCFRAKQFVYECVYAIHALASAWVGTPYTTITKRFTATPIMPATQPISAPVRRRRWGAFARALLVGRKPVSQYSVAAKRTGGTGWAPLSAQLRLIHSVAFSLRYCYASSLHVCMRVCEWSW